MLEKAELTLIIMLSKTKKVITTHLIVLCSVASRKLFYSIAWRVGTLSLQFVPPAEGGGMEIIMNILTTENLKKIYETPSGKVYALDGVSVSVSEGEFIAVVGSSGSGKTTFLNMIGGLDRPTAGQVQIRSKPLGSLSSEELTVFRRRNIGFVFQNYNLLPYLNVWENITLPLRLDGVSADEPFIAEIIKSLGLEDKTCNMPYMLSGGQQQRVAIARALSTKPAIILADEPTGNLDSITGMEVIGLLKTCAVKYHQTIVVVTHNEEIAQMADRIIRIEDGKVTGGADEK